MPKIFFTGFPGFLGSELLPLVLGRSPEHRAVCIVQPKFMPLARERAASIAARNRGLDGRIELVEGDITVPGLGLREPITDADEIFHLAAIYDLAVKRDFAMRINVDGTRNVLDFAQQQRNLSRLQYVSTCYVSGRHPGVFLESDLHKGQTFNNYYEETKQMAEVAVRERMAGGMPATIYRPSVVVGDSTTGETQKYDGPYFIIQWILRQPRISVLPVLPGAKRYTFNVVPRDFIVRSIAHLSGSPVSLGKCYQLADPEPLTIDGTINAVAEATGHTIVRIPLTKWMAKASLDYVPGVYRLMRIPSAAVNYFAHPTAYDTTNARTDLASAGIDVPHFRDYLPRLVEFVRKHPEVSAAAMA